MLSCSLLWHMTVAVVGCSSPTVVAPVQCSVVAGWIVPPCIMRCQGHCRFCTNWQHTGLDSIVSRNDMDLQAKMAANTQHRRAHVLEPVLMTITQCFSYWHPGGLGDHTLLENTQCPHVVAQDHDVYFRAPGTQFLCLAWALHRSTLPSFCCSFRKPN